MRALAIVRRAFPRVIGLPLWNPPAIARDDHIKSYVGAFGAVSSIRGHLAYVESSSPLQSGGRQTDLRLRRRGSVLHPANAPVPVSFEPAAAPALRFDRTGTVVGVQGAASRRQQLGDKAFYANVARDTDFVAAPVPEGAETFFALRSAASPQDLRLSVGLPAGGRLRPGVGQAAAVARLGGSRSVSISRPVAVDAGGQPVPVTFRVEDNGLTLHVDHQSRDYQYPILVDPVVREEFANLGQSNMSGWTRSACAANYGCATTTQPGTDLAGGGWHLDTTPWWVFNGFYTYTNAGGNYRNGDFAQWAWKAYGDSTIVKAQYGKIGHIPATQSTGTGSNPGDSCMQLGFVNASGSWIGSSYTDCTPKPVAYNSPGTFGITRCTDQPGCNSIVDAPGNSVLIQEALFGDGVRPNKVTMTASEIYLTMWDFHGPYFNVGDVASSYPANKWVGDNVSGTLTASAHDRGLGMGQLSIWTQNKTGANAGWDQLDYAQGCAGAVRTSGTRAQSPCPLDMTHPFAVNTSTMPEGKDRIAVAAYDLIHNETDSPFASPPVWVDRTAPQVTPSGALWDEQAVTDAEGNSDYGLIDGDRTLTVDATDGSTASPRSGVASIEMQVDHVRKHPEDLYTLSCSTTGCPYSASHDFTFHRGDFPPGESDHTVTVITRDQLASPTATSGPHVAVNEFSVHLTSQPDTTEEPQSSYPVPPEDDPNQVVAPGNDESEATLTPTQDLSARTKITGDAANPLSPLGKVIGASPYTIDDVGALTDTDLTGQEYVMGAVADLTLSLPHAVDEVVPSYRPPFEGTIAVVPFQAHFVSASVSDLFVHVDFATNTIVHIGVGLETDLSAFDPIPGTPPLQPEPDED